MLAEGSVGIRVEPRGGGGERVFTDLPVPLAETYAAAVRRSGSHIERALLPGVAASRLPDQVRRPLAFERSSWCETIGRLPPGGFVVRSDIRDCFPSMSLDVVRDTLAGFGIASEDATTILGVLEICRRAGVRGLPVGPWASSVLANAVLHTCDLAARAAGAHVLRWVDDVVLVCDDRSSAVRVFDAWASAVRNLGLEPHEGKTSVLDAETARVVLLGSTSSPQPNGDRSGASPGGAGDLSLFLRNST